MLNVLTADAACLLVFAFIFMFARPRIAAAICTVRLMLLLLLRVTPVGLVVTGVAVGSSSLDCV